MSVVEEISEIIQGADGAEGTLAAEAVALTVKEVKTLLETTSDSLRAI